MWSVPGLSCILIALTLAYVLIQATGVRWVDLQEYRIFRILWRLLMVPFNVALFVIAAVIALMIIIPASIGVGLVVCLSALASQFGGFLGLVGAEMLIAHWLRRNDSYYKQSRDYVWFPRLARILLIVGTPGSAIQAVSWFVRLQFMAEGQALYFLDDVITYWSHIILGLIPVVTIGSMGMRRLWVVCHQENDDWSGTVRAGRRVRQITRSVALWPAHGWQIVAHYRASRRASALESNPGRLTIVRDRQIL